jgi:hypothetical protein
VFAHRADIGIVPFLPGSGWLLLDYGVTPGGLGLGLERVKELIQQNSNGTLAPLPILAIQPDGLSQRRRTRAHSIGPSTTPKRLDLAHHRRGESFELLSGPNRPPHQFATAVRTTPT